MTKELYLKPAIRIRPLIGSDSLLQESFPISDDYLDDDPLAKETNLDGYDVEIKNEWEE